MIKAWDKDGNEIKPKTDIQTDMETNNQLNAMSMFLAIISQKCETIVKKIEVENKQYKWVFEQK